jgi:predicted dehydrogenase
MSVPDSRVVEKFRKGWCNGKARGQRARTGLPSRTANSKKELVKVEERLKIIQIGVGFWGWSWVNVAIESPHWDLVGIVDLRSENRERAARHYGFDDDQVFETLEEALKKVKPDAAMVIVGQEAHCDVTVDALDRGLHCLVEKPLAPTIAEARRMVEKARDLDLRLMVSQNYRYKRAPRTIRNLLADDAIGEVSSVFVSFAKAPQFTGFRIEIDDPLITDMAIHHFDQMRHVLGLEPVSVRAYSWNTSWSRFRGDPVASIVFEMEGGAVVSYTGNWVTRGWQTSWDGDWYIQGPGGEVRWVRNEIALRVENLLQEVYTRGALERAGELVLEPVAMDEEDRWASLAELAAAVRENREPETSGRDNLNTLAMVIGACTSIREDRAVSMEEILGG